MQAAGNGHLDPQVRYLARASAGSPMHVSHALHGWQSRTTSLEAQTDAQMIGDGQCDVPPRPADTRSIRLILQETRTCTVGAIRGDTELRYREILSTI